METIDQVYAALYCVEPHLGDVNPEGEITYEGYSRVPFFAISGLNIGDIVFPECKQDNPVFVTHVAAMTKAGVVIGVEPL